MLWELWRFETLRTWWFGDSTVFEHLVMEDLVICGFLGLEYLVIWEFENLLIWGFGDLKILVICGVLRFDVLVISSIRLFEDFGDLKIWGFCGEDSRVFEDWVIWEFGDLRILKIWRCKIYLRILVIWGFLEFEDLMTWWFGDSRGFEDLVMED